MGASTTFQLAIWRLHRMMQDKDRVGGGGIGEAVEVMRELRRRKKEGIPVSEASVGDEKSGDPAEQHQADVKERFDGFVKEETFLGHYDDK